MEGVDATGPLNPRLSEALRLPGWQLRLSVAVAAAFVQAGLRVGSDHQADRQLVSFLVAVVVVALALACEAALVAVR